MRKWTALLALLLSACATATDQRPAFGCEGIEQFGCADQPAPDDGAD